MRPLPELATQLLDAALVGELTVIDAGRPSRHLPADPVVGRRADLPDVDRRSSRRKLEHIAGNPRVSLSITDPVAVGGRSDRVTIQGDARVIDEDPHGGWERLLPIWEAKEPSIVDFLKAARRAAAVLRAGLIEITPRRVLYLARRRHRRRAAVADVSEEAA